MSSFDPFNPLASITPRFTEEQLEEITVWFDENAKPLLIINQGEPTLAVSIEQIMTFLELKKYHRRSYHYPTYFEIMTLAEKLKAGVTRLLIKDQLIYMLDSWIIESEIKHELILAFKVFDTENRNFLAVDEIRTIVNSYGDAFNEAETIEILRDADVRGDGRIFYEDLVESIFSIAPELYAEKVSYLYDNPDEDPSVEPEPEPVVEEPPPLPPPPPLSDKNKKKK